VHDYATGLDDVREGRVRFMGEAAARIREDYLRILRFFRFHASRGRGVPDAGGLAACATLKAGISGLSRERVRQELLKLLIAEGAVPTLEMMEQHGILAVALPGEAGFRLDAVATMAGHDRALGLFPDAVVRLAALMAETPDLRLSNAERDRIASAIRHSADAPDSRRLVYLAGSAGAEDATRLKAALAGLPADTLRSLIESIRVAALDPPANPFSSAEVLKRGVSPGPRMGRVLKDAEARWLAAGLPEDIEIHDRMMTEAILENPD
ncbi:MAG: CCA tRNA nucleotidyltransferase, partial [Beijerinckiaceae bacterium]